jgi:hypothetical protein
MWFLIKGSVWFAAVLVVLSYFSNDSVTRTEGANALEIGTAISAATEAYSYVTAICAEKPDVCQKGGETLSALGIRATEGARVAFELLDNQFGNKQPVGAEPETNAADVALQQDPDPTPFPADPATTTRSIATSDPISTGTVPLPLKRPAH